MWCRTWSPRAVGDRCGRSRGSARRSQNPRVSTRTPAGMEENAVASSMLVPRKEWLVAIDLKRNGAHRRNRTAAFDAFDVAARESVSETAVAAESAPAEQNRPKAVKGATRSSVANNSGHV